MPSKALTIFISAGDKIPGLRILRFALLDLRINICLWFALFLLTRPELVILNLLAAPFLVFTFGIFFSISR